MALTVYEESNISAIADKIREKTSGTAKYTTEEMPDGVAEVYESGKQAERKAFWDTTQNKGNRTNYSYAFAGQGWNNENFNPPYPMRPGYANYMFYSSLITDYEKIKDIDFSNAKGVTNAFASSAFTHIGVIDCSTATSTQGLVSSASSVHTIDKIVLYDGITIPNNTFQNATALANIVVEGVISESINFQWCPLSRNSIESIISHLSDTSTKQTLTLSKTAVNKAFETSASANDGSTSPEWLALVATKQNWAISLV